MNTDKLKYKAFEAKGKKPKLKSRRIDAPFFSSLDVCFSRLIRVNPWLKSYKLGAGSGL